MSDAHRILMDKARYRAHINRTMSNRLYTDAELLDATGLHIDNVRKLVTWGAVRPAQGGRGRGNVRMWDASTVRHIACVAALVNGGLSVKMAHTVVYLDIARGLFPDFIDPGNLAMNGGDTDGWFDPARPLDPHDDYDVLLIVAGGRYIFTTDERSVPPALKGALDSDGTTFLSVIDFAHCVGSIDADGNEGPLRPIWEFQPGGHFDINPESLAWRFDDSLEEQSEEHWAKVLDAAVSVTTVNLSLACKIAMRRLLGMPVFFSRRPATVPSIDTS